MTGVKAINIYNNYLIPHLSQNKLTNVNIHVQQEQRTQNHTEVTAFYTLSFKNITKYKTKMLWTRERKNEK
jgi:hypothetical protein